MSDGWFISPKEHRAEVSGRLRDRTAQEVLKLRAMVAKAFTGWVDGNSVDLDVSEFHRESLNTVMRDLRAVGWTVRVQDLTDIHGGKYLLITDPGD